MAGYGYGYGNSVSTIPNSPTTTVVSYVTTTPYPYDIVGPIENLGQCSQSIIFDCLAASPCAPNDFPCICTQLSTLGVQAKIGSSCSATESTQYVSFQAGVCSGTYTPTFKPVTPSSITVSTSKSAPSSPKPLPPLNTTVIVKNSTMTVPARVTTTQVVLTNAAGKPTTVRTVVPVPVSPTGPAAPPLYTGAAASMKMGALAGAVGFMGLVFAGL